MRTPRPAEEVITALAEQGILAGINAGKWYSGMDDCLIIAMTEKRTDEEVDRLINGLKKMTVNNAVSQM